MESRERPVTAVALTRSPAIPHRLLMLPWLPVHNEAVSDCSAFQEWYELPDQCVDDLLVRVSCGHAEALSKRFNSWSQDVVLQNALVFLDQELV